MAARRSSPNRRTEASHGIAIAALILMALQVLAANAIFAWYGIAADWDVPASAITPGWGPRWSRS